MCSGPLSYPELPSLEDALNEAARRHYESYLGERRAFWEAITACPLGPHHWPEHHDRVVPIPHAIERMNPAGGRQRYKGAVYTVVLARQDHDGTFGLCTVCHAPIGAGDLYACRPGAAGLCLDCVELAPA